jgi:hypothetical protein
MTPLSDGRSLAKSGLRLPEVLRTTSSPPKPDSCDEPNHYRSEKQCRQPALERHAKA